MGGVVKEQGLGWVKRKRDTHLVEGLETGVPEDSKCIVGGRTELFVVPFGRVINPSSFASSMRRSSSTTLSTMIMTDWRSVAAAVDDTTAVQGSCDCDMQLFIVWIMAGVAEREMARKAMRRWRELRAMVINVAAFVEQLTKTGRRRCCVCQSSVVIKSYCTRQAYRKEIVLDSNRRTSDTTDATATGFFKHVPAGPDSE
ncbi:hypothetical protein BGY98DRAFT_1164764 [Russula aff. rugulosa BPL654]|nr:hypothetical protein BGY98DRAFT_1164764 [Russula aff. rugulosa BPL654]